MRHTQLTAMLTLCGLALFVSLQSDERLLLKFRDTWSDPYWFPSTLYTLVPKLIPALARILHAMTDNEHAHSRA